MVGWHHRLNGHGFGWTPGVGDGQGGLVCCGQWGRKELDMTEQRHFISRHLGKESACNSGDLGLISRLGRSPGEGNGNPLQYSCLENPMDGGSR